MCKRNDILQRNGNKKYASQQDFMHSAMHVGRSIIVGYARPHNKGKITLYQEIVSGQFIIHYNFHSYPKLKHLKINQAN